MLADAISLPSSPSSVASSVAVISDPIPFTPIHDLVRPQLLALAHHPLYEKLNDVARLRVFLEHHVFCVWDFMSLLKALQGALTCTEVPWIPIGDPGMRRFINEIVLEEESDVVDGQVLSHFELYLMAMDDIGANTVPARRLVNAIYQGVPLPIALKMCEVPTAAHTFVQNTYSFIDMRSPHTLAAAFTVGREQAIPAMFAGMVKGLCWAGAPADKVLLYLERHLELDGGSHSILAEKLLTGLCQDDPDKWLEATQVAELALKARYGLWSQVEALLP